MTCVLSLTDRQTGRQDGWSLEPVMSSLVRVVTAAHGALLTLRYGREKKK